MGRKFPRRQGGHKISPDGLRDFLQFPILEQSGETTVTDMAYGIQVLTAKSVRGEPLSAHECWCNTRRAMRSEASYCLGCQKFKT